MKPLQIAVRFYAEALQRRAGPATVNMASFIQATGITCNSH
jgi:hypothetical protein